MVKWIDVQCTNSDVWKGGAGAYNEGSLQSDFYPAEFYMAMNLIQMYHLIAGKM